MPEAFMVTAKNELSPGSISNGPDGMLIQETVSENETVNTAVPLFLTLSESIIASPLSNVSLMLAGVWIISAVPPELTVNVTEMSIWGVSGSLESRSIFPV